MSINHQARFTSAMIDNKADAFREVYKDILRDIDAGVYIDDQNPKGMSEFDDQVVRCLVSTISQLPSIYVLSFRINQDTEAGRLWVDFTNLSKDDHTAPITILEFTSLAKPESNVVALSTEQLPPLLDFFNSFLSAESELPVAVPSVALDLYQQLASLQYTSVSGDPLNGAVRKFHLETNDFESDVSIYTDRILGIMDALKPLDE